MELFEPITPKLVDVIRQGAGQLNKSMLADLLAAARALKPIGYDESIAERRELFDGCAQAAARRHLALLYAKTHEQMSLAQVNTMRLIGEVDASVYDYAPYRYLVDEDRAKLPATDENAKRFEAMVDGADLDVVMIDAERILPIANTVGLRIGWEPIARAPSLAAWWPNDLLVLSHPAHPADPNYFYCVMAKVAGPDTRKHRNEAKGAWWEVWRRAWERDDEATGAPVWGPWYYETLSTNGDRLALGGTEAQRSPLTTPWVLLQNGRPIGGSPFIDADRNLADAVRDIDDRWADTFFMARMQSHTEKVLRGNTTQPETITGGPGVIIKVGEDEDLTTLDYNPKIDDNLRLIKDFAQALAVTRMQPPEAYTYEAGAPLTGVSRRVKNEPREKLRRKLASMRKKDEERYILPALIEAWNRFGPPADRITAGTPRMDPRDPPDFEDPTQKQLRNERAQQLGWITPARAATESAYYPNVAAARDGKVADDLQAGEAVQPEDQNAERQEGQAEQATGALAATVNELTLGIERSARIGDIDTLNVLRRGLAEVLGVTPSKDISAEELGNKAAASSPDVPDEKPRPGAD